MKYPDLLFLNSFLADLEMCSLAGQFTAEVILALEFNVIFDQW